MRGVFLGETQRINNTTYYLKKCQYCGTEKYMLSKSVYCCKTCSNYGNESGGAVRRKERLFKGTDAEYSKYHKRLYKERGKANSCQFGCISSKYEWANVTGKYEDTSDYVALCSEHHRQYDCGKLELL